MIIHLGVFLMRRGTDVTRFQMVTSSGRSVKSSGHSMAEDLYHNIHAHGYLKNASIIKSQLHDTPIDYSSSPTASPAGCCPVDTTD